MNYIYSIMYHLLQATRRYRCYLPQRWHSKTTESKRSEAYTSLICNYAKDAKLRTDKGAFALFIYLQMGISVEVQLKIIEQFNFQDGVNFVDFLSCFLAGSLRFVYQPLL